MTALASLSPLLSSDWSTLRLARLSLVDIGGGSEAGVVFIRCVDTWHIYRFSVSSLSQLSPGSELAQCHPPPHIDINSFYEPGPSSRDDSDSILQILRPPDLARHPDCSFRHETVRAVMRVRQCHADTAALTAAPRNILLGSMNSTDIPLLHICHHLKVKLYYFIP